MQSQQQSLSFPNGEHNKKMHLTQREEKFLVMFEKEYLEIDEEMRVLINRKKQIRDKILLLRPEGWDSKHLVYSTIENVPNNAHKPFKSPHLKIIRKKSESLKE